MFQGFSGIQDYYNQIAGSGHRNDLFSSTFSVLGPFDDPWQIQQLYFGSFVPDDSGHTGQSREFIGSHFTESSWNILFIGLPVSLVRRVDFPTEGNPTIPILLSPDFWTSKPSPAAPFLQEPSIISRFSLANLAFKRPKW